MQKDIVPSGQKRFVAEKSQKEIAQKGAERDIWRLDGTKTRRFQPPVDAWLIRSDAVRTRSWHDGPVASWFFRPEHIVI